MNRLQQGRFSTDEWSVALEYIRPLSTWGEPVVVGLTDDRLASFYLGLRGYLQPPRPYRPLTKHPEGQLYEIHWPEPGRPSGHVVLYEHLFERATLSTEDGDTYFWLYLYFGPVTVAFEDVNRH